MRGMTHRVVVQRMAVGVPDAEGRSAARGVGGDEVPARVEALTADEAFKAAQYGQDVTLAVWLPVGQRVTGGDRVTIPRDPAEYVGTWEVAAVIPNRAGVRCLLRRGAHA